MTTFGREYGSAILVGGPVLVETARFWVLAPLGVAVAIGDANAVGLGLAPD